MMAATMPTQMSRPEQCVRIVQPHQDTDTGYPEFDAYHEWVEVGERVKADVNGRLNARMTQANWRKWICNNGDCYAVALVHDDLARIALEAAQ